MNEDKTHTKEPKLLWDWGTAYDMFISLEVLHEPAVWGLRAAWAAGMRSRLPAEERETLEQFEKMKFGRMPLHWIHPLPEPKDSNTVLQALQEIPAEKRIETLVGPEFPEAASAILRDVAGSGTWDDLHLDELMAAFEDAQKKKQKKKGHLPNRGRLEALLDWWAAPKESGERLLAGLRAYQEVFFAEEEMRIRPALEEALERAQDLARTLSVTDLLEELSQGVRLDEGVEAPELVLAPSYWGTPLLIFGMVAKQREMILFGARPLEASLVPGDVVPDSLLRALKALSDPTRLRILRYLSEEPLTPTQLSRRLRLRSSTVVHHLDILRLATLVQFNVGKHDKDRRYAARQDAIAAIFAALEGFLGQAEAIEVERLEAEVASD